MMLKYYKKRYEVIMQGNFPANRKKIMLANLALDMEAAFNMPMQSDPGWEHENKEVFALYHQVSVSRNL